MIEDDEDETRDYDGEYFAVVMVCIVVLIMASIAAVFV